METPKEKAIELYNKFRNTAPVLEANHKSKQRALIAVDEIIQTLRCTDAKNDLSYVGFWNKVKIEIENL
jgi:hypothetical protein